MMMHEISWFIYWLIDWLTKWLNDWNESMIDGIFDLMDGRMDGFVELILNSSCQWWLVYLVTISIFGASQPMDELNKIRSSIVSTCVTSVMWSQLGNRAKWPLVALWPPPSIGKERAKRLGWSSWFVLVSSLGQSRQGKGCSEGGTNHAPGCTRPLSITRMI